METWDAIRSRRNVRSYTDDPIADEDLDRILEAGRRTPSASNWQPWNFVVVTDPDRLTSLAGLWQGAGHVARAAAAIAIVAPAQRDETRRGWMQYDLGQLTMSLMLAATDLGIGSAHAWVTDQETARDVLGFPDDHQLTWLLALGYPADRPLTPLTRINRRDFSDVVHRERW